MMQVSFGLTILTNKNIELLPSNCEGIFLETTPEKDGSIDRCGEDTLTSFGRNKTLS